MTQVAILDLAIKSGKVNGKSVLAACTLCLLGGFFGVHRFYLGKKISGSVMLLVTVFGFLTVYVFIGFLPILVVTVWNCIDIAWIALSARRRKPLIKREMTESGCAALLSPLACFAQALAKFLAIGNFSVGRIVCIVIILLLAVAMPPVLDFHDNYFGGDIPYDGIIWVAALAAVEIFTGMTFTVMFGFLVFGIVLVLLVIDSVQICRSVRQAARRCNRRRMAGATPEAHGARLRPLSRPDRPAGTDDQSC